MNDSQPPRPGPPIRTVLLANAVSPLHVGLFSAIHARGVLDYHVLYLAENEVGRRWREEPERMAFPYEILSRRPRPRDRVVRGWRADRVIRRVLALKPQVIFFGGFSEVELAATLAVTRLLGIPDVVATASGPADKRRDSPLLSLLRRKVYPSFRAAIVPAPLHAGYLQKLGVDRDRIFLAPYSVPGEQYRIAAEHPRQLDGDPALLFVGRLNHEKGVELLIDAFNRLEPGTQLHLVGEGPMEEEMRRRAATSPACERIHFHGFVAREELGSWYAGADLLVVPSVTEPWGLVVNEAMEVGTPVVTSDAVGSASVLVQPGESGNLFRSGDLDDLVRVLRDVTADRQRLARMRDAARESVEQCTFDRAAQGWEAAARLALRGGPHRWRR